MHKKAVILSGAKRGEGEPPRTASGRNFVGGEVNRNERAPQWGVATIEVAEQEFESPGRETLGKNEY